MTARICWATVASCSAHMPGSGCGTSNSASAWSRAIICGLVIFWITSKPLCPGGAEAHIAQVDEAAVRDTRQIIQMDDAEAALCSVSLSRRELAALCGPCGDLRPGGEAELGQDVSHVTGDGGPAQVKAPRDGRVGQAFGDKFSYLDLAWGKRASAAFLARQLDAEAPEHGLCSRDAELSADRLEPLAGLVACSAVPDGLPPPA